MASMPDACRAGMLIAVRPEERDEVQTLPQSSRQERNKPSIRECWIFMRTRNNIIESFMENMLDASRTIRGYTAQQQQGSSDCYNTIGVSRLQSLNITHQTSDTSNCCGMLEGETGGCNHHGKALTGRNLCDVLLIILSSEGLPRMRGLVCSLPRVEELRPFPESPLLSAM